ncbi:hypothetical protein GQ43DRAFT_443066 [Delitschia confertaspora ATCC 74209]|uniref:Uncharacterized protein n=1 Tax=Delitschia confertaspora ATCC 74209 TaxID=1513339 RepID=A0A9P4MMX5_9PLEO|nr:hypothetical protein GQ43DRAFT_443066 [Delitschia confertaspora ATCC 74209]
MAVPDTMSALDSGLRKTMVLTFPFAFTLSIAHVAVEHIVCPVVTLVPMTFSSLLSLGLLYKDAMHKRHASTNVIRLDTGRKRKVWGAVTFILDSVIGGGLLACLIITWILMPSQTRQFRSQREMMLGTYATVPFMINMCFHAFFVLRPIFQHLPDIWESSPTTCPHCHERLCSSNKTKSAPRWLPSDAEGRYSLLGERESDSLYGDADFNTTARLSMEQQGTGVMTADIAADADADIAKGIDVKGVIVV